MADTFGWLGWLIFYIVETLPIYVIARKSSHDLAWLGFVPLANLWLLCDMADLGFWYGFMFLLPYVNIIFAGVIWWRISENTNKPGWVGLLMLIPLVNLAVGYYIAFVDTGGFVA